MRACGRDLEGHPIFKELERVELYMKKIKRIEEKSIPDNNVFKVDKVAARKMIQRGMGIYKPEEEEEEDQQEEQQAAESTEEKREGEGETKMSTETQNNNNKRKAVSEGKTTVSKKKAKI